MNKKNYQNVIALTNKNAIAIEQKTKYYFLANVMINLIKNQSKDKSFIFKISSEKNASEFFLYIKRTISIFAIFQN